MAYTAPYLKVQSKSTLKVGSTCYFRLREQYSLCENQLEALILKPLIEGE